MKLLGSNTLTNQNISSALLTHTYTADADRSIYFRLFADQVVGNGYYTAYISIQRGGVGSAYRAVPITTANAASGVTAIALTTGAIPVSAGDVLRVYLQGLAGDTTTPDIITEVHEDNSTLDTVWTAVKAGFLTGDAFDRLGVPAGASVSADIATRLAAAGYTAPDNVSIAAIKAKTDGLPADPASMTDIANAEVSILSAIPAAPDNAGIAAIKAKTDNLPTDPADQSIILDAIAGVSPSSAVLSLAVSQAEADSASRGEVSLTSYHQLTQSITTTSTEDVGAAEKIWFAIKDAVSEVDASSLIFVEKTAGLSIVAKANYATTTDGSLVVTGSSGNWSITITIKAAATALLHEYAGSAKKAECKALIGGQPILLWSGSADIYQGVIRVLS